MCRNHSHITTNLTGHLVMAETVLDVLTMDQPLEVQFRSGERVIRPSGTILLLPVWRKVPLPAYHRRMMEAYFIPSFFTGDSDMIIMPEQATMLRSAGAPGATSCGDTEPLPPITEGDHEQLPRS